MDSFVGSSQHLQHLSEKLSGQVTSVKVYTAAFLVQNGLYYTAIKVALEEASLLRMVLDEIRLVVSRSNGGYCCCNMCLAHHFKKPMLLTALLPEFCESRRTSSAVAVEFDLCTLIFWFNTHLLALSP